MPGSATLSASDDGYDNSSNTELSLFCSGADPDPILKLISGFDHLFVEKNVQEFYEHR